MSTTAKVIKYELRDITRSKWIIAYGLFFMVVTDVLFRFSGGSAKALMSLSNIVLIIIPLVSIVFGTMYLYNAREFTELLLTQPIDRKALFGGLYAGLAFPLAVAFLVGIGVPFAVHGVQAASNYSTLLMLIVAGVMLTFVFVALAFLIAVKFEDKVRALGIAVLLWLFFSVIYDGAVLLLVNAFSAYPLEQPMIALMLLNPVDLARILLLLTFDISALMGYTGAVFEQFFGSMAGTLVSLVALAAWLGLPLLWGGRLFNKKDF